MDFERVLRDLVLDFSERGVRCALIGGFAMGALGIPRATMDLDFLVRRDDLTSLDAVMERRGFRLAYRSENVSQYVSDLALLGQVDFLHAFREVSTGMLDRAREVEAFGGTLRVRALLAGDIIGLKVQALANDPRRERQDMVDIHLLAERYASPDACARKSLAGEDLADGRVFSRREVGGRPRPAPLVCYDGVLPAQVLVSLAALPRIRSGPRWPDSLLLESLGVDIQPFCR